MENNNKHLVRVGHEFAATMSDETPIITIAKMVTELATALDVQTARSEALAAENAALKELKPIQADWICNTCATIYHTMNDDVAQGYIDEIRATLEREILLTPATDAFLAEVRAQGVELVADHLETLRPNLTFSPNSIRDYAAQIRKGMFDDELRGNSNGGAL